MSKAAAPPEIVVLGGGSAGWITACLLARAWGGQHVTVVESPAIGIIGVGEGSTPQLKAFFDQIGVAEADWMPACDATYKLGIRFTGWSERPGYESYFHPFPGPTDLHTEPAFLHNCALARRGIDVPAHPDAFFLASQLAAQGKGPHPGETFPFAPSYGYHFDAHKLGAFLRDHAVTQGVTHLERKVVQVELDSTGDVAALNCEGGERIAGDLFVDCSGFASVIAQQALGEKFLPFTDNLFNDSAVVIPGPRGDHYLAQTEAIAMAAGWRWAIPLASRIGNGYVYSSRHISAEDAELELRGALGIPAADAPARHLSMKVGRVENSWTRNCLAAGLAQGFLEPLEATALHIVIATAQEFISAFEAGGFTAQHRGRFNASIAERFDAVRDYIVAHYRLNQRNDTEYWRENSANQSLSDSLKSMMTAWFTHQDVGAANEQAYRIRAYSAASWHCLMAGYGTFPRREKMQAPPDTLRSADMAEVERIISVSAENFAALHSAN